MRQTAGHESFDWTVLRTIEEYAAVTTRPVRTYARVVMPDHVWPSKLDDDNRGTFSRLQQRKVLEVERIRREEFTGGEYRELECELADGMIALGGGKGTYIAGRRMMRMGKPVLPIDLEIGALSEDGEGARLLHREMQSDPSEFLPNTHHQAIDQIEVLSLDGGTHSAADVARRAAEVLGLELNSSTSKKGRGLKRIWTALNACLTAFGVFRAFDFLKHLLFGS